MQFTLKLTTEELKTLQGILEDFLTDYHSTNDLVRDLLTKVIVVQCESEELSPRERAYLEDAAR